MDRHCRLGFLWARGALLGGWPLTIWQAMNSGLPFGPATLETLPYPIGALVFWIIARGLKLSTDLPPRA